MKAQINMNENIRVRLTDLGYEILAADKNKYAGVLGKEKVTVADLKAKQGLDGTEQFQLWVFMQLFGPHISITSRPICENNEIILA